jgi:hypothetical protein
MRRGHARFPDSEGDGYDFEGRFMVHVRETELARNATCYQPAADRRDRLGRVRRSQCPFDPPREREPLNFGV